MENYFNIDDKEFKLRVRIRLEDEDGRFNFNMSPSEIDNFKKRAKENINLVKCEHDLYQYGFRKDVNDKWNISQKEGDNNTFKPKKYFYKDGDLLIKFGQVSTNLDFTLGSLSTLQSLPDKIVPFKGMRKVYESYTLTSISTNSIIDHTFSKQEYNEYCYNSIKLPIYEANEDKVNRWFNNEFETLVFKNFNMDFIDWYLDKHEDRKDRIYRYFEQGFNVLIAKDERSKILKYKSPKGFIEWIIDKKGERIKNLIESIKAESKFKL